MLRKKRLIVLAALLGGASFSLVGFEWSLINVESVVQINGSFSGKNSPSGSKSVAVTVEDEVSISAKSTNGTATAAGVIDCREDAGQFDIQIKKGAKIDAESDGGAAYASAYNNCLGEEK